MSSKQYSVIDIETWPMPDDHLVKFLPARKAFNADSVKCGNIKDPAKIEEKIEASRQTHEAEQDGALDALRDKAALDPMLSRIFAAAISDGPGGCVVPMFPNPTDDQEKIIINAIWARLDSAARGESKGVLGWNIQGFDIPFIWKRSIILGIKPPIRLLNPVWNNHWIKDLSLEWCLNPKDYAKLSKVALALGLAGKLDLDGELPWQTALHNPELCLEYTRRDGMLCWEIADRLGMLG